MAYPLRFPESVRVTRSGPVTNPSGLRFAEAFRFTNIGVMTGNFKVGFREPAKMTITGPGLPSDTSIMVSEWPLQMTVTPTVSATFSASRSMFLTF